MAWENKEKGLHQRMLFGRYLGEVTSGYMSYESI